jgi:hypothetical protein
MNAAKQRKPIPIRLSKRMREAHGLLRDCDMGDYLRTSKVSGMSSVNLPICPSGVRDPENRNTKLPMGTEPFSKSEVLWPG